MIPIFLVCYPLKIICTVIQFIAVLVVYLWFVVWIRNIFFRNETMNEPQFPTNANTQITLIIQLRFYFSVPTIVDYIAFRRNSVIIHSESAKPH